MNVVCNRSFLFIMEKLPLLILYYLLHCSWYAATLFYFIFNGGKKKPSLFIYYEYYGLTDFRSVIILWIGDWTGQYGKNSISIFGTSFGQHSRARRGSFWRCLLRSALGVRLALTRWAVACVSMSGTTSLLDSAAWQPTLLTHPTDRMCPPAAGRFLWRSQSCIA